MVAASDQGLARDRIPPWPCFRMVHVLWRGAVVKGVDRKGKCVYNSRDDFPVNVALNATSMHVYPSNMVYSRE